MDSREYEFEGRQPEVHGSAHVSREATLVGDVTVAANASVWPGVVLRGDVDPVEVGHESHVGDNASVHGSTVGERVMIGHGAVLNDATVGDRSLVGFNATVSDATIGEGSVVATGAVVYQDREFPPESFVRGNPARADPLEHTDIDVDGLFDRYHSGEYANLAARHGDLFD